MQIYDCFIFFNELDLLELRLNELSSVVDTFVIVESPITFQGKPKPLHFHENRERFAKFNKQIRHIIVNDMPDTNNPWDREHHQRNALRRGMYDAKPDDMMIVADADEILTPKAVTELKQRKSFAYIQLKYYAYYLNYELVEGDYLPLIKTYAAPWSYIQGLKNLTSPRDGVAPQDYLDSQKLGPLDQHLIPDGGWHFSWLGDTERMIQKMDAFSHTEERFEKLHNADYLARSVSQKRFLMDNCRLEIRPLQEMPLTVQKASGYYQRKGMLAPEQTAEQKAQPSFSHVREATPLLPIAEARLGREVSSLTAAEKKQSFSSYFNEIGGSDADLAARMQYEAYLPYISPKGTEPFLSIGRSAKRFSDFLRSKNITTAEETSSKDDILNHLKKTKKSYSGIALLEETLTHMPFDQIDDLVEAAVSKLTSGGALLIEALNIRHPLAFELFYTDPLQQRPLTEGYLSFLMEWHGLKNIKIIYTNPVPFTDVDQNDVQRIYCTYAAIGYKPRPKVRHSTQCPVCGSKSLKLAATKLEKDFLSCEDCKVIFLDEMNPSEIAFQNNFSGIQSTIEFQKVRLQRITEGLQRAPNKILDFGCGRGYYVDFLKKSGCEAIGIDKDTPLKLSDIERGSLDAINLVEMLGRLGNPLEILTQMRGLLKPDGIIYIEGSFADHIGDPAQSSYIDPNVGQICVHSRQSVCFITKKLKMDFVWLNNHVVLMQSRKKVQT